MIDDCNINILAKNQLSAVFNSRAIRRSVSSKFIEICMETPCWCPSGWAPTWRPETNRNICHLVLLQKRKFFSRGTQKDLNNTFPNTRTRSDSEICRNKSGNKSLFNQLGRHVNVAFRKSLEIQAWSIAKPRTHSEQKLV